MYFPNAFRKSFLPTVSGGTLTLITSGNTSALTAGQLGMYSPTTWTALSSASTAPFVMVQGSYFTADKIGPFHGGYKESVKSKVINPRFISRVMRVSAKSALNQIITVGALSCAITCNSTYRLRLDIKGSPALRYLNHNLYKTLDAFSGCCNATGDNVDPNVILLQWRDQINADTYLKEYVSAKAYNRVASTTAAGAVTNSTSLTVASATGINVGDKISFPGVSAVVTVSSIATNTLTLSRAVTVANGAVVKAFREITTGTYTAATGGAVATTEGQLELTAAYTETQFGNATFTPTDFYELEPVMMYASVVDESGEPCLTNCFSTAELQAPVQTSGSGETVLRDMILSGRYQQEAYPDSTHIDAFRMREIEANPGLAGITRSALYDQVLILHNVPRFNNPSGVFDNDQYLLVVHVPTGTTTTSLTNFVVSSANAAQGTGAVTLEVY